MESPILKIKEKKIFFNLNNFSPSIFPLYGIYTGILSKLKKRFSFVFLIRIDVETTYNFFFFYFPQKKKKKKVLRCVSSFKDSIRNRFDRRKKNCSASIPHISRAKSLLRVFGEKFPSIKLSFHPISTRKATPACNCTANRAMGRLEKPDIRETSSIILRCRINHK